MGTVKGKEQTKVHQNLLGGWNLAANAELLWGFQIMACGHLSGADSLAPW